MLGIDLWTCSSTLKQMPSFTTPFTASAPCHPPEDEHTNIRAIRFQIAAELEAVNQYDEIIQTSSNPLVKAVVRSILLEEKTHVGELLALLYSISPIDRSLAADGESEVSDILVAQMRGEGAPSGT